MDWRLSRRDVLAAGVGGAAALVAARLGPFGRAWAQEGDASAAPLFYRRQVGELEVTAISDGFFAFPGSFFVNIAPEEVEAALAAAFLDPAVPQQAGVTAHLVQGGGRTLLIDSGAAGFFGPTLGRLPAALALLGVTPEEVDAVLVTHLHIDHIGGLLAGDAPAFPNASLRVTAEDVAFWTDEAIAAQVPADVRPLFDVARATIAVYGERVETIAPEGEVLPGITSLALPGHTVGHVGYRLASGGDELLVFGDAANSAAVQFRHPDAGLVFDTDAALAAATRRRLFDMLATDRTLAAGTHLPFPGIGHVARSGDAYAWVPETWRYE